MIILKTLLVLLVEGLIKSVLWVWIIWVLLRVLVWRFFLNNIDIEENTLVTLKEMQCDFHGNCNRNKEHSNTI